MRERDFHERRANDGDDPVRKRENARKQTRNHDTTAAYVSHAHARAASARTCTFTCSRPYGRQSPAVRHAGFSGGATKSEGATRDARRISEEVRETACGTEAARERERESGPEARGVLAWMTRHCRGARVPRNHTACTRVYHADARVCGASRHQRGAIRSVCPCPLGDLEMCVMKNAQIIAGHSFGT